jgi:DNA-binding SARP family transcriptional activator
MSSRTVEPGELLDPALVRGAAALYRVGRQADALRLYRETRQLLVEELGVEPSAELQQLERQILAQEERRSLRRPSMAGCRPLRGLP